MLNKDLIDKLRDRYKLHPLIFSRSLSKSKSDADLFDILDSFPDTLPAVWCDEERRWVKASDPYLFKDFEL